MADIDVMSAIEPSGLKIAKIRGVPVHVHWTFPVAALVICINARFEYPETLYLCVGYALLILLHELGHAFAARYFGLKVIGVEITGTGGFCLSETPTTFIAAIALASAGILVQLFLFIGTVVYLKLFGNIPSALGTGIVITFIIANGVIIVLNLIPLKLRENNSGTDGYLLWKLFVNRIRGRSYVYPDTSPTFPPKTSLIQGQGYMPPGFKTGIELLNDNDTTMEFVVTALTTHLYISQDEAIDIMHNMHSKGGVLIPLPSYEIANKAADAITMDARENGFELICRSVSVQ